MLVPQVLRKQTERDASVKELAEAMVNFFSWVKETEGWNHKLERFSKTIEMMAQQASSGRTNGCRAAGYVCERNRKIKRCFLHHTLTSIAIESSRTESYPPAPGERVD